MAIYNVQMEDSAGNVYTVKPDLLTTKEQLSANNKAGKSVDALVIKEINNNLNSHPQFIYDESGRITGYKTVGGADTVFPFSSPEIIEFSASGTYKNLTIAFENKYKRKILFCAGYITSNKSNSFQWDFMHENGLNIAAIDAADTVITVSRNTSSTSTGKVDYKGYIILA